MSSRSRVPRYAVLTLLLAVVTSCVAPELRTPRAAPQRVTDARDLVRQLVPDADATVLARLAPPPDAARGAGRQSAAVAAPFLAAAAALTDGDASRARGCLTAAVYYEARSEPVDGQRAVAQVVLNRVRDRAFPHSVCGVVYQGVGGAKGCQFSFACDGSTLRPRDPDAWARAEAVAVAALNGDVIAAVGNATFYHAGYVLPWWAASLTRLGAIGNHIFYRWPGALERALGGVRYAGVEPGAPTARTEQGVAFVSARPAGVTIHRGVSMSVSAESDPPFIATPASYAGVRVHRGEEAPVMADEVSTGA